MPRVMLILGGEDGEIRRVENARDPILLAVLFNLFGSRPIIHH